jgi:hypothetical protein
VGHAMLFWTPKVEKLSGFINEEEGSCLIWHWANGIFLLFLHFEIRLLV